MTLTLTLTLALALALSLSLTLAERRAAAALQEQAFLSIFAEAAIISDSREAAEAAEP